MKDSMSTAREAMVDSQVRPSDIHDRRVITAMLSTPREDLTPPEYGALAYADRAITIGPGRHLWAARDFSKLVQATLVAEHDRVLDVAPGTGYSTRIFSKLGGEVVALEEAVFAEGLKKRVAADALSNVKVIAGDLAKGAPSEGPFDVIFVNGAVEVVPDAWLKQLAEGGRLAVIVRERGVGRARIYNRAGDKSAYRTPFDAQVPDLPGFGAVASFQF
jgi:protein-L-isoaspartate(D-aspartate) O-methyltransferase